MSFLLKKVKMMSKYQIAHSGKIAQDLQDIGDGHSGRGESLWGKAARFLNTQVPLKEVFFSDNKSIRCGAKRWTVSSMFSQNLSKTSGICEAWSAMLTAE